MRNDLYVGALVALGAHAALALVNTSARLVPVPPEKPPVIEIMRWQPDPVEPDPEPVVGDPEEPKEITVAAPRLPDVPRVATSESFTMPPTAVPDGVQIDPRAITIPTEGPRKGRGTGDIIDLAALDRAPLARFQAQPHYPFDMKKSGITGEVLGSSSSMRTARCARRVRCVLHNGSLRRRRCRRWSKWTFRPGQKGGRNVATRMQVPIVFSLNAERD